MTAIFVLLILLVLAHTHTHTNRQKIAYPGILSAIRSIPHYEEISTERNMSNTETEKIISKFKGF